MTPVILRSDQSKLNVAIDTFMAQGARNVLAVMPTGGGKSVVVSHRVKREDDAKFNQVVIAHRQELVGQMSLHVARGGVYHQIIGPKGVVASIVADHRREFGRSYISPTARCSVAGVDTLVSRQQELGAWALQQHRWTIDEAHHVCRDNKWGTAVKMFPNAWGLGVTATPQRADGRGLGLHSDGVFDAMVLGPTMREMINAGNLAEYEFVIPESDFDVDMLRITDTGDYSPKQMREASKASHIVGDVVKTYIQYAYGKKGITFATDVETAQEIAARFNQFGIPAACVSAKTPDAVRSEYIRQFRDGKLSQLVNVDLFGEGFDVPNVEVVSMARPTASLAVYLQQVGRALRVFLGKLRGLIIDHVSNLKRHGLPDQPRFWTLDRRDKRAKKPVDPDEIELKGCANCSRPYPPTLRACPYCGFAPVPIGAARGIEQVEGDLMLLDAATLAKMREGLELASPGSMTGPTPMAAKHNIEAQIERIAEQERLRDAIGWWAAFERAKGRPDHESYRRFYIATGGVDVLSAQKLPRADMEKLRLTVEGWLSDDARTN